jgi:rare lipoprotein A
MKKPLVTLFALTVALLISACSSKPTSETPTTAESNRRASPNDGRYQQEHDSKPSRLPTLLEMTDPTPKAEALSRGGNNPYNIFGQDYLPLAHLTEHEEIGIASWYGNKFHGHLTSNGETYNMFGMTAAHKTLPLPSYVRVTNLDTNQSAIVRVNDRGPFHQDRVIDLSYSAAYKIGMLQRGTARVKVELLKSPAMLAQQQGIPMQRTTIPEAGAPRRSNELLDRQCYIQLFAISDSNRARQLQQQITNQWSVPTEIRSGNGLHRVLIGPTADNQLAKQWLNQFRTGSYPQAFFVDGNQCG